MNDHLGYEIHNLPVSARDLSFLILGKRIGNGISRTVYEFLPDNDYVVKVENTGGEFQNVIEWEIWKNVEHLPVKKWFAPCLHISDNGIFLIQKKVERGRRKDYPKKVPYFFRDRKYDNYGFIGKQFVVCDYATFLREDHFMSKKMRKADWWDL